MLPHHFTDCDSTPFYIEAQKPLIHLYNVPLQAARQHTIFSAIPYRFSSIPYQFFCNTISFFYNTVSIFLPYRINFSAIPYLFFCHALEPITYPAPPAIPHRRTPSGMPAASASCRMGTHHPGASQPDRCDSGKSAWPQQPGKSAPAHLPCGAP